MAARAAPGLGSESRSRTGRKKGLPGRARIAEREGERGTGLGQKTKLGRWWGGWVAGVEEKGRGRKGDGSAGLKARGRKRKDFPISKPIQTHSN